MQNGADQPEPDETEILSNWTSQTTPGYKGTVWTERRGRQCEHYHEFDITESWKSCYEANLYPRFF